MSLPGFTAPRVGILQLLPLLLPLLLLLLLPEHAPSRAAAGAPPSSPGPGKAGAEDQAGGDSAGGDSADGDSAGASTEQATVIVVVGAAGTPEFGEDFARWGAAWKSAAARAGAKVHWIGPGVPQGLPELKAEPEKAGPEAASADGSEPADRQQLATRLAGMANEGRGAVWLVLLGHGTFDGRHAKFNLRGPDVSAAELKDWLAPLARPLVVVNCASASAPFLEALAGPGRVIVTATKSGYEQNYARFGHYLAEAIGDLANDLDKDRQVSILEAFLAASKRTQRFYDDQGRLATEHALLDDNGDRKGVPADWFVGTRAVKSAKDNAAVDGELAGRLALVPSPLERALSADAKRRRDQLEAEILALRRRKPELNEDDYYRELETVLVSLAKLYREVDNTAK